jgi:hypothetical protein
MLGGMSKSHRPGAEAWRPIIDGQRLSGLTVAAYCRERRITQGSFYAWKRRLRSAAKPGRSLMPAFVEVTPPRVGTVGTIEICLRGERRLLVRQGFDRDVLVELVRTLESVA